MAPPPAEPTAEYRESVTAGPPLERVRIVLIGGSGGSQTDDLYRLLRRRLFVIITIGVFFYLPVFVFSSIDLLRNWEGKDPSSLNRNLIHFAKVGLTLLIYCGSALCLWRRPPASVFGLRIIELLLIGNMVVLNLSFNGSSSIRDFPLPFDQLTELQQAKFAKHVLEITLAWFVIIVVYGAIVPNTFRRALLVCIGIALCPLAQFHLNAFWLHPIPSQLAIGFTIFFCIYMTIAISVVAFSSSRVERYRRQASEARKLGQYLLKEKLGSGGMGEVYRAEHVLLRRPCALKMIRPERAGDADILRRFEREVQITATLTHANTVQVFDYGHAEDGTFYYVMEYLPGLSLEELVRRHGPLPPSRAVHFLRQVCAALGEAHARGLTHRDIKPGNVMVCERGGVRDVVKVLDFGLVRIPKEDADDATLTREGAVAGTPAYMSPEQASGENVVDPRSDLYSVGALAYFLLTGRPPFSDRSPARMLAAHIYESPRALPEDVPADLADVVLRCMAKSPAERWPDAATLEEALASTSVPVWTARDALAWWESKVGCPGEIHSGDTKLAEPYAPPANLNENETP